jgi:hypothetical protein
VFLRTLCLYICRYRYKNFHRYRMPYLLYLRIRWVERSCHRYRDCCRCSLSVNGCSCLEHNDQSCTHRSRCTVNRDCRPYNLVWEYRRSPWMDCMNRSYKNRGHCSFLGLANCCMCHCAYYRYPWCTRCCRCTPCLSGNLSEQPQPKPYRHLGLQQQRPGQWSAPMYPDFPLQDALP